MSNSRRVRRTTISVHQPTRDRVTAVARAEHATVDELLSRLLDEHEERAFWRNVASTAGEPYASEEEADLAAAEDASLVDAERQIDDHEGQR